MQLITAAGASTGTGRVISPNSSMSGWRSWRDNDAAVADALRPALTSTSIG
ncbi:hypothetical protein [Sciscionella marina]|uniref:hypothetical protein n=1 Tax=Sciscionella marina TaxID=508770 RepID=UPI000379F8D3|nr:hypothetical protein [Sciscionella marina]